MGRPRMRPLLPSINRFLVGERASNGGVGGRHLSSSARGVLDMRRARPERVRGDPRPFPWQGGHRGRGRRGGPPPPDSLQQSVLSASSAPPPPPPPMASARSEDVPPRFHDLVTTMVRSMVHWGVAAGVVTVVDGPNAIFRLHAQAAAAPVSHTPPRHRPRLRIRTCGVVRRPSNTRSKRHVCTHRRCRQRQHRRRR